MIWENMIGKKYYGLILDLEPNTLYTLSVGEVRPLSAKIDIFLNKESIGGLVGGKLTFNSGANIGRSFIALKSYKNNLSLNQIKIEYGENEIPKWVPAWEDLPIEARTVYQVSSLDNKAGDQLFYSHPTIKKMSATIEIKALEDIRVNGILIKAGEVETVSLTDIDEIRISSPQNLKAIIGNIYIRESIALEGRGRIKEIVITDSEKISEASTFNEKFTIGQHDQTAISFEIVETLESGEKNPFFELLNPESVVAINLPERESNTAQQNEGQSKDGAYYKFKVKERIPKFSNDKLIYQINAEDYAKTTYSQQGHGLTLEKTGTIREIAEEILGQTRKNTLYRDLNKDLSVISYQQASTQIALGFSYKLPYINYRGDMGVFGSNPMPYASFITGNNFVSGEKYDLEFDLIGMTARTGEEFKQFDAIFDVLGTTGGTSSPINDPQDQFISKNKGKSVKVSIPFTYYGSDLIQLRVRYKTKVVDGETIPDLPLAVEYSISLANFKITKSKSVVANKENHDTKLYINHTENFEEQFSNLKELRELYGNKISDEVLRKQYASETKMTYSIENSNLYNALLSLAELFNAQVKFDYLDNGFYFVSNDHSEYKGYRLHPEVNISSISRPETSSEFATVLHINGGGDVDGVIPPLPREWRSYLSECVNKWFDADGNLLEEDDLSAGKWFELYGKQLYTGLNNKVFEEIDTLLTTEQKELRKRQIENYSFKLDNGILNESETINQMPTEWESYLTKRGLEKEDIILFGVEWFNDKGPQTYQSLVEDVKDRIESSDSREESHDRILKFAQHMDKVPNFESTLYDFSYFNNMGMLVDSEGEKDYTELVDLIYNKTRKLNIALNIYSYKYYLAYSDFTSQLQELSFYLRNINVEETFQHNSDLKLRGDNAPDRYTQTWVSYMNAIDKSKATALEYEEEVRNILGLNLSDNSPSLDLRPGTFAYNALTLFGYLNDDKNGVKKLVDENQEKINKKEEERAELIKKRDELENKLYPFDNLRITVQRLLDVGAIKLGAINQAQVNNTALTLDRLTEQQKEIFLQNQALGSYERESLAVELAGVKSQIKDTTRYLGLRVGSGEPGTGFRGIYQLESKFYNLLERQLRETTVPEELLENKIALHERLFDKESKFNLVNQKEELLSILMDRYEPFTLEARYENSEEVTAEGLLEQGLISFSKFNRPQVKYDISTIHIGALEDYKFYKHPEVGDKILLDSDLYLTYDDEDTDYLVITGYSETLRNPDSVNLEVEKDDESELLVRRMLESTNFILSGAPKQRSNYTLPVPQGLPTELDYLEEDIKELQESDLSLATIFDQLLKK